MNLRFQDWPYSTLLTRKTPLQCSLRSILVLGGLSSTDWLRHRRLALCLRWRILTRLLRIAWIRRRRLSIALWRLVVIPWRRVMLHVLCSRRLGCWHERLVPWLCHNHCPRRTMAVVRATRTTTASHDGNNNPEKHDYAEYSAGNNTSGPHSRHRARWQTVAAITAFFACATFEIVRTVVTLLSADTIWTARLAEILVTVRVKSTVCSASYRKELGEEKGQKKTNFLWRHVAFEVIEVWLARIQTRASLLRIRTSHTRKGDSLIGTEI